MRIDRTVRYLGAQRGFTLVEMIGVLAIIAILAAAVAPRVFDVIADSRGTRMATEIRAIETAVSRYYADVGTIKNLDQLGETTTDTALGTDAGATDTAPAAYSALLTSRSPLVPGVGLWKRFRGPYLEKFIEDGPAVGTSHSIEIGEADDATVDESSVGYDLDGDGTNDTPGDSTQVVVWLEVTDVAPRDFDKLDSIFDDGVAPETEVTGRVKYASDGKMRILIAYR